MTILCLRIALPTSTILWSALHTRYEYSDYARVTLNDVNFHHTKVFFILLPIIPEFEELLNKL